MIYVEQKPSNGTVQIAVRRRAAKEGEELPNILTDVVNSSGGSKSNNK